MKRALSCLLAVALTALVAKADSLSGTLTVDNAFTAYLSTSSTVTGAQIASGDNWNTTSSFSGVSLTPGTTYFLQIDAINFADGTDGGYQWGAILGDFSLSGTSFEFSNGSQSLLTETTDWTYSYTGFGQAFLTPHSQGANGVDPWGTVPGISGDALWIWDTNIDYGPELYFETEITPMAGPGAATPEPESLVLFGSGLLAFAGIVARRRRAARA